MFPSNNTSWVGVGGPHHRLDFHQQPGRPMPGPKTYHDAEVNTVVITNGSTNSQKLPICKLDKEQILARIEMKTEIINYIDINDIMKAAQSIGLDNFFHLR